MASTTTQSHDPTVRGASTKAGTLTPQEKLDGLFSIVEAVGTAMLTSRSPNGRLASRAMAPASTEGFVFSFYFNRDSGKTDDIQTDPEVNVSYYDPKTTDWVSISGRATINADPSKVKRHWSKKLEAWFDNKRDGKHTGSHDDPRVVMLDVHPSEVRYFKADGRIKAAVNIAKAAVSGEAASPGKLVVISEDEINLAARVHSA